MKRIAILLSVLGFHLSAFGQGDLTPPAPPGPTFKTLQQIEPRTPITNLPYTISVPGSYYLTTNLTGSVGTTGIVVSVDNVSIDLNGFALIGSGGSVGSGILVSGAPANLSVRNGTIRDWGSDGVNAGAALNTQFERLIISGNASNGLHAGRYCQITQCIVRRSGRDGILCEQASVVSHCVVVSNSLAGIETGISGAPGAGTASALITSCVANDNAGAGLQPGRNVLVLDNECAGNAIGIFINGTRNRIEGNNLVGNGVGLHLFTSSATNMAVRNSASGNSTNYVFTGTDNLIGPTNNPVAGGFLTNTNPWANFSF